MAAVTSKSFSSSTKPACQSFFNNKRINSTTSNSVSTPSTISRSWSSSAALKATRSSSSIPEPRYNFNTSLSFDEEPEKDHLAYRKVTARDLQRRQEPPTRVKMLVRDFIDDSLYNPQYGYFSKQAQIFSPNESQPDRPGFDFKDMANLTAFQESVASLYEADYGRASPIANGKGKEKDEAGDSSSHGAVSATPDLGGLGRQVWHTPTELFKPHYAHILCKSLLSHYKLHHFPYSDFLLYEVGAGNGSLMVDMMCFLRDEHPEVYERTKYTIIEISSALAQRQKQRVTDNDLQDKVTVVNKDFFEWDGGGRESCYFVALEVLDNFAHDLVRYDLNTLDPYQGVVCIDAAGDFSLIYEPITDPVIRRYLSYRRALISAHSGQALKPAALLPPLHPLLLSSPLLRRIYRSMPFSPNLSQLEFIPTKQMMFLEGLRDKLPFHKLLISDFDVLPDTVDGRDGPVVQTRYGDSMVPCGTFLVKQGFFDIFFPTNFELLREMYNLIMKTPIRPKFPAEFFNAREGSTQAGTKAKRLQAEEYKRLSYSPDFFTTRGLRAKSIGVYRHSEFLEEFGRKGDLQGTTMRDGSNVMLSMYKNVKFMF